MPVCVVAWLRVCVFACLCVFACVHSFVCAFLCSFVRVFVRACVLVCIPRCVYMCVRACGCVFVGMRIEDELEMLYKFTVITYSYVKTYI